MYGGSVKMSDAVEWALHVATLLAALRAHDPHLVLPAKALAEYHGVSESYLLKALKLLTAAGLLVSVPGPRGGYRLARDPREITLHDVVEAVDGPGPVFHCANIRARVPFEAPPSAFAGVCAIRAAMHDAEAAYRARLRERTVAEIAAHVALTLDRDLLARGEVWLAARVR